MKSLQDILLPVIGEIQGGQKTIEISGLWGASKALFLSGLMREAGKSVVVITATEEDAESLIKDLRFFKRAGFENAASLLPGWGLLPFEADSPDSRTVGERMRFLYNMTEAKGDVFIVPITSLMQKLPPWEEFVDSVKTVSIGSQIDPDSLVNDLVSIGYESASMVARAGEFSRRGGILDIFSPYHDNPIRLEFFGDSIESMREFDPESQRSIAEISEAIILPVREAMDEGEMDGLFRYFSENNLVVLIEPDDIRKCADEYWEKIITGRQEESEEGRQVPEAERMYLDPYKIEAGLTNFPMINFRLLTYPGRVHKMDTKSTAFLGVRLTKLFPKEQRDREEPVEGTLAGLVDKFRKWRASSRIFIVCGTEESSARLKKMFSEYGLVLSSIVADQNEGPWPVVAATGRLSEGFSWPDLGLIFITEEEIFGKKIHPARSGGARPSKITPFLSTFKELKPGDFVVHTDYGVGEYQGLSHIAVDGHETDFLALRYEPDAKLYVPLYSLDKVQKYAGVEGSVPKLDRLGAPAWAKTKERVRKDILELARELVAVYAARETMQRAPFSPPDNLYREFESAFPYEETPDQQRAIEDVLSDMQRPRPMDRLVCGDVGYGKTEVALRAAFKAVEDGMQAAVLVPTTLLADQHYRTFTERLGPFPIRMEMLSRFRTRSEQRETLKGLKNGTVDIVIGTHRLLQRDVFFKNLGLLVVDEEHRFGVRHKERIKEFKKLVDVLTLTATPIPRTLHMSLSGIRDLSIIQTPPLDRQAIQVALARFGKRVIREAIVRELDRGGQVFFVHNRVQGIERMADFIRNLTPEAKIGIAHGQMNEHEMEDVMSRFLSGSLNVLVTTSIIESGIDIPTANTIIINHADRFGLADLYQIKGRVGRGREKAYAYLLTPAEEILSDIARKRLRAIQELSELGAGFRIAALDMETRGAGNLLGKQQSGHIAAVGIDLYTQMMEDAVAELRGQETVKEPDTLINLHASAFIPEDYISDVSLRLAAYKQISSVSDESGLSELTVELKDRYGELPEPASNLLEIMKIKLIAKKAGVARIDGGKDNVNVTFSEVAEVSPDKVMALLKKKKGRIKLIPEYALQIALPDQTLKSATEAVKKCLQELL